MTYDKIIQIKSTIFQKLRKYDALPALIKPPAMILIAASEQKKTISMMSTALIRPG